MNYRYIVVEGSIGSGKNALSRRLAEHFHARCRWRKTPNTNPFLMKFYANASHHGLATELFFLMRRAESVDIIKTNTHKAAWWSPISCWKKTGFSRRSC